MALKKDLEELNKRLQDIERLSKQFGSNINTTNLRPVQENAEAINSIYRDLLQQQRDFNSEIDVSITSFNEVLNSLRKSSNSIAQSKKSLGSLNSIAQKLSDTQKGYTKLSLKDIENLKEKAKIEESRLSSAQKNLSKEIEEETRQKSILETQKKQLGSQFNQQKELDKTTKQLKFLENSFTQVSDLINGNNAGLDSLNTELQEAENHAKKVSANMGLGGAAIDSMSTALDKLGLGKLSQTLGLDEAKKVMEDMAETNALGGTIKKTGVLKAGIKSIGKSFIKNITDPAAILSFTIKQLFDALKLSDKGAGDLAKGFNMSYGEANATRQELSQMAALSGDVALNTKALQESLIAVGNSLGSNASLNEKDLKTFTKLREQAGYTNDELVGIQKLSLVNGKSLEDNTKEILGGAEAYASQKGLMLNEKQILRDISKASNSIKLSLGGSADELAKAAVEARAVGLNLEQVDKIADSLLQFESSITAELEAEMLLGRDINLEKARQLALNNDLAGAAKEIASQVGTAAEFGKMNRIQQEALAKAVGMQKDELASMLMDQEALTKLSGVEGKNAKEKFNNLVKEVGMEEAKKRLGDDQLASQFEQQSVQERFQQGIMKLQELFIQLAEPVLAIISPFADLVGFLLPAINALLQPIFYVLEAVSGVLTGNFEKLSGFQVVLGGIVTTLGVFYATFKGIKAVQEAIVFLKSKENVQTLAGIALSIKKKAIDMGGAAISIIGGAFKSLSPIPIVGAVLAAAAAASGIAYLASQSKKGNDVLSPGKGTSGYGDRTLLGPEGAIQLNNKDTVIAGTDLFADDMISAPKGEIKVANSTAPPPTPKSEPAFDSMKYIGEQISTFKDTLQVTTMVGIQ